jgi:hypothetical protein
VPVPKDSSVKILFRTFSEILEDEIAETILAEIVDAEKGYFKLGSVPFYIPKVASGDIVWAEFKASEGVLTYRKTIQFSGNSTVHVIIMDDGYDVDVVREILEELGCKSQKINKYFALDIPADVNYLPIKRKLDELQKGGALDYAESCLSDKHQYKDYFFSF